MMAGRSAAGKRRQERREATVKSPTALRTAPDDRADDVAPTAVVQSPKRASVPAKGSKSRMAAKKANTKSSQASADVVLASTAVGHTFELIEKILLDAPANQLFTLQRVSSVWRDVIGRSQYLKKKMWLMPRTASTAVPKPEYPWRSEYNKHAEIQLNPLAITKLASSGDDLSTECGRIKGPKAVKGVARKIGIYYPYVTVDFTFTSTTKPTEPWRQLLITEPAITAVHMEISESQYRNRGHHKKTVQRQEGLRLGDLYDEALKLTEKLAAEGICVSPENVEARFLID